MLNSSQQYIKDQGQSDLPHSNRLRLMLTSVRFCSGDYCHVTRKHAISLLFMIFALATLFDQSMPPYSAEEQEYYLLARIALRWAPPAYDTTLAAIQSMVRRPILRKAAYVMLTKINDHVVVYGAVYGDERL